jgi:hypothetical protein
VLPSQHQASIGYERQLAGNLSVAVDYVHMVNLDMPLRYNLNPGIKQTTGRTAPVTRVDFMGIASQLGLSRFSSDVYIVENIGETRYDGVNMQVEKRFSNFWSARVSYAYGNGRGNTNGTPTATNDYQVLEERNLELNEGPTTGDRHHTVTLSGRIETPWVRGLTFGAIYRAMSGQPFTIVNSNVDADRNNILADPVPAGTYSGNGPNAITVENKGGRNGAYGPDFAQLDLRAGYRVRTGSARTLDLFLEIFNATNRVNFNNPTGDMRNANFLVPTSLLGGGFPRQYQIGARFGF